MSNNLTRIDSFLQFVKDILKQNPDLKFKRTMIYEWITKLEVSSKEYDIDLAYLGWFNEWNEKFPKYCKTKRNQVNYFLRFGNLENNLMKINNPLKVYIPIDYEHLKEGFDKILSFLIDSNIPFQGKVAREMRIDNIVVRLSTIEDTKKLVEFINSDEYIKEGLKAPSPFCFNYNGVALTLDANLSYHVAISNYIFNYINKKRETNTLDTINVNDFFSYMEQLYNDYFINYSKFAQLEIVEFDRKASAERNILTTKEITYLLANVNKEVFNEETFFNLFKDFNKPELVSDEQNDLCVLRCISAVIVIQGEKTSTGEALKCLKKFVENNETNCITNSCSLRESLLLSNFIPKLKNFLTKYNTSIEEIYYMLANDKVSLLGLEKKTDQEIEELDKKVGPKLMSAIEDLAKLQLSELSNEGKNKAELIKEAIKDAMKKIRIALGANNPGMLTRTNNIRQKIFGIRNDLITLMFSKDTKLPKYMNSKMEESELLKQYILQKAIFLTYNKYQKLYEDGNIDYSGESFVTYSLDMLVTLGNYDGFTRDESARDNLTALSKEEVFNIITNELGKKDVKLDAISDDDRTALCSEYTSKIISINNNVNTK